MDTDDKTKKTTADPEKVIAGIVPDGEKTVLELLREKGVPIRSDCGGNGLCGKCRVSSEGEHFLACRTVPDREMTVIVDDDVLDDDGILTEISGSDRTMSKAGMAEAGGAGTDSGAEADAGGAENASGSAGGAQSGYCLAVDLGTTTVAAQLISPDGRVLAEAGKASSQRTYGDDVISRIQASCEGKTESLRHAARGDVDSLRMRCAGDAGIPLSEVKSTVIAGNTAMEHLYMGYDVKGLAEAPYSAVTLDMIYNAATVLLPCISPFVGADVLAGMAALDFDGGKGYNAFIDIGTNGEIALAGPEGILVTSTAAGPALEGAGISCGMAASTGAVRGVEISGELAFFDVIGGDDPKGLCGSGVIALTAELLKNGILDRSGAFARGYGEGYRITRGVLFTQEDVRKVQTAKAAIRAGLEVLLAEAGIEAADLGAVYVAGGFGKGIDPDKAMAIGLFPEECRGKVRAVGNTSLAGAAGFARGTVTAERLEEIKKKCRVIELANDPRFQTEYISNMDF